MPIIYSSNEINKNKTLTPIYRIRRDSHNNNQSESSSISNQNLMQQLNNNNINNSSQSPSTSNLSKIEGQQQQTNVCAVCGDGHAKLHYGVLACYGCKGFFRRTLTGNYRYICRFGNQCIVNKFQRNSCRCCRFNRCIEVGMDPKAVRPDRDLTGKQRVPRVRKRPIGEELIGHMMRLHQRDDWTKKIPAESRLLLMQLMIIESNVIKGDNSNDTLVASISLAPISSNNTNNNKLKSLSLRELFENRLSSTKRTEMNYEPYRMAKPEELSKIAHRGAIAAVDWVESLMELINDSIAIVKNCYAPLTIFNFSARTAQKTKNPDILCLCSFSFVPRKLPSEFNGSNHLSNNLIDRTLNELVAPLRKLDLKEEEVVALKATIILDPNTKNISEETQQAISLLRNAVQDMLFHSIKELHPLQNAASRFGNLLLLLPTITTLSCLMSENMQFCQVFGWTDPLLNELFNNLDEEKSVGGFTQESGGPLSSFLAEEEDSFDILREGNNLNDCCLPISFSPPILGGSELIQGNNNNNTADIYNNYEQPSPPLPQQNSSSSSSSLSNSSSSPFNSSTISCVCLIEKCEISTQTEPILNFNSLNNFNISMDSNQQLFNYNNNECNNNNEIFFGEEEEQFNNSTNLSNNSPFQDLLFDKDSYNFNINKNQNNSTIEDFQCSSDLLFFNEGSSTSINSSIMDINDLMQ
ncbi:Nuclear hormone receptor family member nhr-31 [Meloidogyne graminicola]|uniref:Nuclear hormone receptor family member nhr-31 n=1 Tax=Meloidogyne graminicola TaxID=189291 RepID=A0A8S9ZJJ4_9BILA|nr:Nuclear hormone receptor family member nhr-31 [Meloidogyne graminicola]